MRSARRLPVLMPVLMPVLVLVLLVGLLVGCSSRQDSYCDAVKDHQADLGKISGGATSTALIRALPIFRDLQDNAPDDIQGDWRVVVTAVQALDDALQDADVDAATYNRDKPPSGVTQSQRTAIDDAASGLTQPDTVTALGSVQQQSLDVCHTPLYL